MTASRKITEAETILAKMQKLSNEEFEPELRNFAKTINDVFLHLLDEYNVKFRLGIQHLGLDKFKTTAKKIGNLEAINFLIWYEKEYKKLRNDPVFGQFFEKDHTVEGNKPDIINACSLLLAATKKLAYQSYENF